MDDDTVRFELLGPLRAWRGGQELELGPAKQRAVLAALLVAANRLVPTGRIIESVWGTEPPVNGINVVQKYVAGLRRVLEPDRAPRSSGRLIVLTEGGYRLSVAPGGSDLDDFTGHVRQANQLRSLGRLDEAAVEMKAALSHWRAEPLTGLTSPYFDTVRARLTDDYASAVEDWAELEIEQGNHLTLLPELNRLVMDYPLRERLRGVQMLALYRTGRQAEALTVFREVRGLLADAYGVEPGPDLQSLHHRILQNDPALTRPPQAQAPPASIPEAVPAPPVPSLQPSAVVVFMPIGWRGRILKAVAAILPLISVGVLAGLVFGVIAIARRSGRLGIAAAAYQMSMTTAYLLIDIEPGTAPDLRDGLGFALALVTAVFACVHAAMIVPRRVELVSPEAAQRRQEAREVAAAHPQHARRLGIGRPDLAKQIDDGGLIDLNAAPEAVLRTLPGVSASQAAQLVADRTSRGRFHSIDELVARGLFPAGVPAPVADMLLIIGGTDTADGNHR